MKKVININFQGTIIPIEETAYEILQKYTESLRRHFANEDGREEIINDIETRISELFSETLKKGSACIDDDSVNAIISSMGRPEDFDSDGDIGLDTASYQQSNTNSNASNSTTSNTFTNTTTTTTNTSHKRLYRDENHKILGGVCSGIANYFNIDPVIMRIIAIIFSSVTFIPYIVIWIVVPSTATKVIGSPRKRLFRDTDNKKIAGVCSGLAQYFGVSTKLVRILFLLPFISIAFKMHDMFGWSFPHFLSLSFSPAATIAYIILWILVPEAKTTSDKLEMKGKPVDMNSIKDTVQNDLNDFKDKAKKWRNDISNTAQNFAQENSSENPDESNSANQNYNNGFSTGNTHNTDQQFASTSQKGEYRSGIPTLLKVLGYIILGLIVTPILLSLFVVGIGFMAVLPATDFVLKNGWETVLAWGTILFFVWVPIIGIILWFFRRITKSHKSSSIIRGSLIGLWILGWICFFGLFSMVGRNFSHSAFTSPSIYEYKDQNIKTMVVTAHPKDEYSDWGDQDFNDILRYLGNDSIKIPNVALRIETSKDNNYHVESVAYANGSNKQEAMNLASSIVYSFDQKDSMLYIPTDFYVNRNDKFRNQRIMIKIYVPIGKQIIVKGNTGIRHNIDINIGPAGIHRNNWDNSENYWDYDILYVMTTDGLQVAHSEQKDKVDKNNDQKSDNKKSNTPEKNTGTKPSPDNDDNDEESANNTKASNKKYTFFSMASLLSNKFFL